MGLEFTRDCDYMAVRVLIQVILKPQSLIGLTLQEERAKDWGSAIKEWVKEEVPAKVVKEQTDWL